MNKKEPDKSKNITKKQRKARKDPAPDILVLNRNKLPKQFHDEPTEINTHSWFNITERTSTTKHNNISVKMPDTTRQIYKSKNITILPTKRQKRIFNTWFDGYTKMYNETVKYIRKTYQLTRHNITQYKWYNKELSFQKLRDKMKSTKDEIVERNNMYVHVLDTAIKLVASNLKSGISNLKKGHMRRIRLNYWKFNRNSKTIEIEKEFMTQNGLCFAKFGKLKYIYNGEEYELNNINHAVKLNYNRMTRKYTLYVPDVVESKAKENTKPTISLDPGLRTFMTGVSENKMVEIGNGVNYKVCKKLERYNAIKNNENISETIKKKYERRTNRKISDSIDDLQWKTIKYLTDNYDSVLLGDMSSQGIVSKESNILTNTQKVSCLRTKYYMFQQRLQFKCEERGLSYLLVNEYLTSKTCSNCGAIKNDLGKSKTYDCKECGCVLDRDVNGARNIWLKVM